jgi:photosystem II stability/assembly factor-like uncharacterized protein
VTRAVHPRLLAAAAALALLAPVGTVAHTDRARAAACARVTTKGAWTAIASPFDTPEVVGYARNGRSFENSPYGFFEGQLLGDYAVDPDTPSRLLASDGLSVVRSTDGGCSWTRVYSVATPAGTGRGVAPSSRVLDLVVESTHLPTAKQRMYVLVVDGTPWTASLASTVATSGDGGATWTSAPVTGAPCQEGRLAVAPSRPTTVYLDCFASGAATLWVSTDAGAHWAQRVAKEFATPYQHGGFRVSPVDPEELWVSGIGYGPKQYTQYWNIQSSTNGGRTWRLRVQSQDHLSFYLHGMQLVPRGRKAAAVVWNADGAYVFEPSGAPKFYTVPQVSGQAGPVEQVSLDGSRLLFVVGYGVTAGDETYHYGPTCTEGQRLLSLDLRAHRWTFLPAPVMAPPHVGYALFDLRAVPVRNGVDYYLRESGFEQGQCPAEDGSVVVGLRESYLLRLSGLR